MHAQEIITAEETKALEARKQQWADFATRFGLLKSSAYEAGLALREMRSVYDAPGNKLPFKNWSEELKHASEEIRFDMRELQRCMQVQEFADAYGLDKKPRAAARGIERPIDLIPVTTLRPLMTKESVGTTPQGVKIFEYREPQEVRQAVAGIAIERFEKLAAGEIEHKQAIVTKKDIEQAYVDAGYENPADIAKEKAERKKLAIVKEVVESGYDPSHFIIEGDDALIPRLCRAVTKSFVDICLRMKPSAIDTSNNMTTQQGVDFLAGLIAKAQIGTRTGVTEELSDDRKTMTLRCVEQAYDGKLRGVKCKGDPIPFVVTLTISVADDAEAV
jgi:hypothetical protein